MAASLHYVASGVPVTYNVRQRLAAAARPLAPAVRASILAIPSKGLVPYQQPPGLRLRIASTVVPWAKIYDDLVTVGVEIDASRMPDGQKALPLYMEGAKAPWRHPLFGNREHWQMQDAHPYFYQAVAWYGPAARTAIDRALDDITAILEIH